MRATLADISGRTGYSKSTVSIALRNDPRVPVETRRRIQDVAQRLGYRPDPNLARIAAARWRQGSRSSHVTIAFLFDSQTPAPSVLQAYRAAARERAAALGYAFTPVDLRAYPDAPTLCRVLDYRGTRGLLVPPVYDETLFDGFDWPNFAVVGCGQGLWRPPGHTVNTDVFATVQLAVNACIESGHQRIGAALFTHPGCADDDHRRRGAALVEIFRATSPGIEIIPLTTPPEDQAAFLSWFEHVHPDVVIALHRGVARWLSESGIRIPQDVGVVCLGANAHPNLARVDPQLAVVAQAAVDVLDLALRENELGPPAFPRVMLVSPTWHPGPSLVPPGARQREMDQSADQNEYVAVKKISRGFL